MLRFPISKRRLQTPEEAQDARMEKRYEAVHQIKKAFKIGAPDRFTLVDGEFSLTLADGTRIQ